ncbi:hypothetical protein LPB41_29120 [Thalassospira sp. MA62]|nr:hypothetical protein [Thalassospira sp. MA62]
MMKCAATRVIAAIGIVTALPAMALAAGNAGTEDTEAKSWRAQKCSLYQQIRNEMFETIPPSALSPEFVQAEDDYIENGCAGRAYACPKSDIELDYANQMSFAMMSQGLTGTFLPYGCQGTD